MMILELQKGDLMKKSVLLIIFTLIVCSTNITNTSTCSLPEGSYRTYCKGCKCENNEIICDSCPGEWGQTNIRTSIPKDACKGKDITTSDTGNLICNPPN